MSNGQKHATTHSTLRVFSLATVLLSLNVSPDPTAGLNGGWNVAHLIRTMKHRMPRCSKCQAESWVLGVCTTPAPISTGKISGGFLNRNTITERRNTQGLKCARELIASQSNYRHRRRLMSR